MSSSVISSVFDHAPQTKALLFTMFAGSCAFNFALKKYTHILDVTYSSIFTNYNIIGFLLSRIITLRINDIICFCIIIYNFRKFEQRMGLHKFSNLLFGISVMTMIGELSFIFLSKKVLGLDGLEFPSGPLGIVFALTVYYYKDIMKSQHLGNFFIIKLLLCIAIFHLATKSIPALAYLFIGLTCGTIYRNLAIVRTFLTLPKQLNPLVAMIEKKLSNKKEVFQMIEPIGATLDLQRQDNMDALERRINNQFGVVDNVQQTMAPPREEQIDSIVAMGFNDRDQIKRALMQCNNNTERAINQLLSRT